MFVGVTLFSNRCHFVKMNLGFFTLYCLRKMHQFLSTQVHRGVLVRIFNVGAARQTLAVGLGGSAVVEGSLLHDDDRLVDTVRLFGRADGGGVGVSGHVEGDASTVLKIDTLCDYVRLCYVASALMNFTPVVCSLPRTLGNS